MVVYLDEAWYDTHDILMKSLVDSSDFYILISTQYHYTYLTIKQNSIPRVGTILRRIYPLLINLCLVLLQ